MRKATGKSSAAETATRAATPRCRADSMAQGTASRASPSTTPMPGSTSSSVRRIISSRIQRPDRLPRLDHSSVKNSSTHRAKIG